jgi:hypothetical protein
MTDAEKIAAFDLITDAFTNRWYDGRWSWLCHTPSGGPLRATRREAVSDLIVYAKRESKHVERRPKLLTRIPLAVLEG